MELCLKTLDQQLNRKHSEIMTSQSQIESSVSYRDINQILKN